MFTVLPAIAHGDDRLDLMLLPQPVDQLVVVIALVGAHAIAPFQQLGMTLVHLIKQPLRLRLLAGRRLGDLERQRQLVGGVHHQVQQVAEPVVLLLGWALDAPVGIPVAAPVGVLLILGQRIGAFAVGQGVQLLAVQCLYVAQIRQLDPEFVEGAVEYLIDLPLMLAHLMLKAGIGGFTGHRRSARERVEPAQVSQLSVAQQLAPQGGDAGMLEHEAGDQRVPHRAHRVIVATTTAPGFQQLHQRFVGKGVEHQLQTLEITELVDAVPAEQERF